ncbi:MAG: hypothetical protein DDT19_00992 [Syntrophomonadaceae bacterium]|nr:hypothetical protein [Bacillota bacterium]
MQVNRWHVLTPRIPVRLTLLSLDARFSILLKSTMTEASTEVEVRCKKDPELQLCCLGLAPDLTLSLWERVERSEGEGKMSR